MSKSSPIRPLVILAAFLVGMPLLARRPHPAVYEEGWSKSPLERVKRNGSAVAAILGEFRTGMSDMMFVKIDRYLHAGIAFHNHADEASGASAAVLEQFEENQKAMSGSGHSHSHDHGEHSHDHGEHSHDHGEHSHDHGEHSHEPENGDPKPLLRTRDEDFRGIIGDWHREVTPWRDPRRGHAHSTGVELLPWFKLMTLSDPHYVRGYVLGAFWLKSIDLEEALAFIEEGRRKNPKAFQVFYMKGMLLSEKVRRMAESETTTPENATDLLDLAREQFGRALELALEARPTSREDPKLASWDDYKEYDAIASVRMAILLERDRGRLDEAIRLSKTYAAVFGSDDVVLKKYASMNPGDAGE